MRRNCCECLSNYAMTGSNTSKWTQRKRQLLKTPTCGGSHKTPLRQSMLRLALLWLLFLHVPSLTGVAGHNDFNRSCGGCILESRSPGCKESMHNKATVAHGTVDAFLRWQCKALFSCGTSMSILFVPSKCKVVVNLS